MSYLRTHSFALKIISLCVRNLLYIFWHMGFIWMVICDKIKLVLSSLCSVSIPQSLFKNLLSSKLQYTRFRVISVIFPLFSTVFFLAHRSSYRTDRHYLTSHHHFDLIAPYKKMICKKLWYTLTCILCATYRVWFIKCQPER